MINHEENIEFIEMQGKGIQGVKKQIAVGPRDGWSNGYMRIFTLAVDGHTAAHSHPWWHVNYILEGEGLLFLDGVANPVKKVLLPISKAENPSVCQYREYRVSLYLCGAP